MSRRKATSAARWRWCGPATAFRSTCPRARSNVEISEEEFAARRAAWTPPKPRYERGYGWMFSRHIEQAEDGCDFDFLRTDFGAPVPEPEIF